MIFTKIEIKDIDLLPVNAIPVIEKQLWVVNNKLHINFPDFIMHNSIYELKIYNNFALNVILEAKHWCLKKKSKGLYLKFDDDFILTETFANFLQQLIETSNNFIFIFDFGIDVIHHSSYIKQLIDVDYMVLKGMGYWNYSVINLEQGKFKKLVPGYDTRIESILELKKFLKGFNLLLQFSTSGVEYTKNGTASSVRRSDVMNEKYDDVYYETQTQVLQKMDMIDTPHYLIENLAFDLQSNHPHSIFQLVFRWPSLPIPFPVSILSPRKQSKIGPMTGGQKYNQEDSCKKEPEECIQIFELEL